MRKLTERERVNRASAEYADSITYNPPGTRHQLMGGGYGVPLTEKEREAWLKKGDDHV